MNRLLIASLLTVGCQISDLPTKDKLVDETGYLDVQLLRYSAQHDISQGPAAVRVVGLPTFLLPDGALSLSNLTSGVEGSLQRGPNGDFVGTVAATVADELEIVQVLPDQTWSGTLTIDQDFADLGPPINGPQTGPLYPAPQDGFTEMDLRQTALAPPFVLFNTDNASTLAVEDATAPIRLAAEVGDEVCVFLEDVGDGLPGMHLCGIVSTEPAAP